MTPEIHLASGVLFHFGQWGVTTTFLLQVAVTVCVLALFTYVAANLKSIPGKLQLLVEMIFQGAYSQINNVTKDDKKTRQIFPFIFTLFVFICFANYLPMIPGLGAVKIGTFDGHETELFRPALADYGMVMVMTLLVIIVTQLLFVVYHGVGKYIGKWLNFSSPINFVLGIIELISEVSKILSLSFRLFGNVFAGETLTVMITWLVPLVVPFPFYAIHLFVLGIQAYVFCFLSTIYLSGAMEEVEHH